MFLSQNELECFNSCETVVYDQSITRRFLEPVWKIIALMVPEDVAPNLISLAGLLCLIQAWYLCYTNGESFPFETTLIAIVLITLFFVLDAIDSIHAQRIGNANGLTEFFDHLCSSVGTVFLVLTLCRCYSVTNMESVWHYVQVGQLLVLNKHLSSLKKEYISYRLFSGPGEAIILVNCLLALRALVGETIMDTWFQSGLNLMEKMTPPYVMESTIADDFFHEPSIKLSRTLFFWMLAWTVLMTLTLKKSYRLTKFSLLLCYMYLIIPSGLTLFSFEISLADVVSRGLVTAMLGSDLVVARMANRQIHPWVVIVSMVALVSNLVSFVLVPFYYATVLFEVISYTTLPLLTRYINVYQDGVFDMPHIGHMKAFRNAAKMGTRLFVGVANDADATIYKRRPVMSASERYEVVGACKYVFKVIENAPCVKGDLNEEFIRKHNIHIVCCGEEYNDPNDEWYAVPRKLGMIRTLPRHSGMSTSELIKRIQNRDSEELTRKAPALMST